MTCIDANTCARARTSDISTRGEVAEILVAQVAQVARSPSSFPVLIPLSISLFLSFDTSPFLHLQKDDVFVFVVARVSANKFISRGDLY